MPRRPLVWFLLLLPVTPVVGEDSTDRFRQDVAAILSKRCVSCHHDQDAKGGLSLTSAKRAFAGGDSGPAIEAGYPEKSLLLEMITGQEPEMPKDAQPLTKNEIEAITEWIASGAGWPDGERLSETSVTDLDWWSLQTLARPRLPQLETSDQADALTPMDAFVIAKQRENGVRLSPLANRATLIRRLYFDLIGIPPEYAAVQRFVHDDDPLAYEKLVDQLLASPGYGERWTRHWLDVVHYGDTHGYDKDKPRPHAWPYRDYVIRSFNDDKPYARFVMEQIAGDVLWPSSRDGIEATGFVAAGPWDFIGHAEVSEEKIDGKVARHLDRDDMVTSTMNTFLSMTVQCARCHHHKFDPVRQEHYYSLQSVFAAIDRADRTYDVDPDVAAKRSRLRTRRKRLDENRAQLQLDAEALAGAKLDEIDAQLAKLREAANETNAPQLADLQSQRTAILLAALPTRIAKKWQRITAELKHIDDQLDKLPVESIVYAGAIHHGSGAFRGTGHNGGKPREVRVLNRGNVLTPGDTVRPGTVPIVENVSWQFDLPSDHAEGDRRAALARWLVRADNPLVWRSIVNRIWLYHFGRGIVDSPNDFGRMGQLPTHPELLDWLAITFRDNGQSFKKLHRMIVCSRTYRQVSTSRADFHAIDGENRYLWRMNRKALEAEAIRDSMLIVAGKFNRRMYGPAFMDFVIERPEHSPHYEYHKHDPDDPTSHRRSVYRFLVRSQQQPFMQVLDCADPSESVAKRTTTMTPIQALTLLNNPFTVRMTEHFAKRLQQHDGTTKERIRQAYRIAFGRDASLEEVQVLSEFADQFGLNYACRVMLNLNEFVLVD